MIRALVPAIAGFALLLAACQESGDPSDASQTPPGTPANVAECSPARGAAGDHGYTLDVEGVARTYVVHVPPQYSGAEPTPVMLGFHGLGMTGATFAGFSGLPSVADEQGFLLVMLDGAGAPSRWNARGDPAQPDDVQFVEGVLAAVEEDYCVDANRVYAAGYSNGGGMALALACALPQRIAAIGVTAATYLPCRENVPMIAFHGVNDAIVPFEGGETPVELGSQTYPSVRRAVSEWARAAGCDAIATISRDIPEVELSTFRRCFRGDGDVLLYTVVEGGHTWPGMPVRFEQLGYTTMQISASELMWQFFEARSTAAP